MFPDFASIFHNYYPRGNLKLNWTINGLKTFS